MYTGHASTLKTLTSAFVALGLLLSTGCVTPKRTSKKTKNRPNTAVLSMNELSEGEPVAKPQINKSKAPAEPKRPPEISPEAIAACEKVVNQIVTPHRALFAQLAPGTYVATGNFLDILMTVTPAHCQDPALRAQGLAALRESVNMHSGRIGVILPLSGPRAKVSAFIVEGMRVAFQEAGLNFDKMTVLKDSTGVAKVAEQRLAELVFKEHPSLIIGGMDQAEAEMLARYAGDMLMPTIILSRDRALTQRSNFVFNVYPDEKRLADTLVASAAKRGLKRFALLRPASGKSDKVSQYFRDAVGAAGGRVIQDLVYTSNNFDSMQGVARQLFKTESSDRIDEYRAAYKIARQNAQDAHVPFDPRQVVLRPIVDFDAVFIPDDFRIARHFAKLFAFYQVNKLTMIGNHEWRSPALVEPFDAFLEGSFFADFIGGYDKLPPGVSAPTMGSPYFVHPQNVVAVDFRLIGYRVARTARMALKSTPPSRRTVNDILAGMTSDNAAFFGTGKVFDAERQSNWPTYVFNVSKGQLMLEPTSTTASVALSQTRLTQ